MNAAAVDRPRGLLLVVSSPSGAGKTTLSRRLVRDHRELSFSVSYTTRPPRPGEVPGSDYHFVTDEVFDDMVEKGCFAEWAHVYGRRYGTAIETVREALDRGGQVLFDIDYQGAERLLSQFPAEARLVYILPPSMAVLSQRLRSRGTDSPEVIERRLRKAQEEFRHYPSYHYLVLNDDIERAYAELSAIYQLLAYHAHPAAHRPPSREVTDLAEACLLSRRSDLAEALVAQSAIP